MLTEKAMVRELRNNQDAYLPLKVEFRHSPQSTIDPSDLSIDIKWRDRKVNFAAEMKTRTSPKGILQTLVQMRSVAPQFRQKFLLLVPYLSKTITEMLIQDGVSGLDLNGNYLIQTDSIVAIRVDRPNRFTESQPIKKIFSKNSSIVGRLFLVKGGGFQSLHEIGSKIAQLGGSLSLSAISKLLKALEEELIIEKTPGHIHLLQPEKLLERLGDGYVLPTITGIRKVKIPQIEQDFAEKFVPLIPSSSRWVISGESSAKHYTQTAQPDVLTLYTNDFGSSAERDDDHSYNLVVKETPDFFPFFDSREIEGTRWSSPLQCYLELSKLAATQSDLLLKLKQMILTNHPLRT